VVAVAVPALARTQVAGEGALVAGSVSRTQLFEREGSSTAGHPRNLVTAQICFLPERGSGLGTGRAGSLRGPLPCVYDSDGIEMTGVTAHDDEGPLYVDVQLGTAAVASKRPLPPCSVARCRRAEEGMTSASTACTAELRVMIVRTTVVL
jgi:hypothetical protein